MLRAEFSFSGGMVWDGVIWERTLGHRRVLSTRKRISGCSIMEVYFVHTSVKGIISYTKMWSV